MPSRQALELLQVRQIRSPGQLLRNSSRHLRHLRSFVSYLRSGSGFEFFSELLMARIYSSSSGKLRHICCSAKGLFYRPIQQGKGETAEFGPIRRAVTATGGRLVGTSSAAGSGSRAPPPVVTARRRPGPGRDRQALAARRRGPGRRLSGAGVTGVPRPKAAREIVRDFKRRRVA